MSEFPRKTGGAHGCAGDSGQSGIDSVCVGFSEDFSEPDKDRVEAALADMNSLGAKDLRLEIPFSQWRSKQGEEWYSWLIPRLASCVKVLPSLVPDKRLPQDIPSTFGQELFANALNRLIELAGEHFSMVEIWGGASPWGPDWKLGPEAQGFFEMTGNAARLARARGKKTILGGICPCSLNWLDLLCEKGALAPMDCVGVDLVCEAGHDPVLSIEKLKNRLERHNVSREIWITKAGYCAKYDEIRQLRSFQRALEAPVKKIYWKSLYDPQDGQDNGGFFGIKRADKTPKLLYRYWEEKGAGKVGQAASLCLNAPLRKRARKYTLVIGGAGFIGTNLSNSLLEEGEPVLVYDNVSRPGVEQNLAWLKDRHGSLVDIRIADILDRKKLRESLSHASRVFDFAAQVAVTTSLREPLSDFSSNALGTITLLEEIRGMRDPAPLVYTSTNKVYGCMKNVSMTGFGKRYVPSDPFIRSKGISEKYPLDLQSPYGCSKGSADQYVLDYSRTFGLNAVVLRMSCIYGPHQFGTEDQGWVAHFLIKAIENRPIVIYGDGMQVRDLLYVDDLVRALILVESNMARLKGKAFNMGGGPSNSLSLLELIGLISELQAEAPKVAFAPWRAADQKYYVSDFSKFREATGWEPKVKAREGVASLYEWLLAFKGRAVEKRSFKRNAYEIRPCKP